MYVPQLDNYVFTNHGRDTYNEHMNKNDEVTQLPKRILSVSLYVTPITNQANVANRLRDTFGREAHDKVWSATPDRWANVAREYVDLVWGDHYGTRWINDDGTVDTSLASRRVEATDRPDREDVSPLPAPIPATSHASFDAVDTVASQHPSASPLAAVIQLFGRNR